MQNNNQNLSREELYAWATEEMRIKNHLYYYLMFTGQIQEYRAYFMVFANDIKNKEKSDEKMFRTISLFNNLCEVVNVGKNKRIDIEYTINPN